MNANKTISRNRHFFTDRLGMDMVGHLPLTVYVVVVEEYFMRLDVLIHVRDLLLGRVEEAAKDA